MDLGEKFGFDQSLADEGVDVVLDGDGSTVRVAMMPNARYDRFIESAMRRYRAMGEAVPEAVHEEAFAKYVLLGWSGLNVNGQAIEPSEENRLRMIREFPRFKGLVASQAADIANFKRRSAEVELKN